MRVGVERVRGITVMITIDFTFEFTVLGSGVGCVFKGEVKVFD